MPSADTCSLHRWRKSRISHGLGRSVFAPQVLASPGRLTSFLRLQTLGGRFQVDGRLKGTEDVKTVQCDQTANTCQIKVPAPGAALVFISDAAQQQAAAPDSASTYATTVVTKTKNTATVDPAVIATSNGQSGKNRGIGGTSQGGENGAVGVLAPAATSALTAVLVAGLSASLSACLLW